jgi:hypothetical protein
VRPRPPRWPPPRQRCGRGGRRGGVVACARGKGVSKPFIRPPNPLP